MAVQQLDVLQVITSSHRRGAETYALELGRALAVRCRRVDTVALTAGADPTLDVEVLGGAARSPATLRVLRRRASDADVVVAHGSSTLSACALATVGGPPFVYRVIGDPTVWAPGGWRKVMVGRLLRRAAAVTVYFPAAAEALITHHGLDPAHIHVVPKGIDVAEWPVVDAARRTAARHTLGLDVDQPVVAWIGALTPEKRPEVALAVAAALPEVRMLVAGAGPSAIEVAAHAGVLGGRAVLLGAVTDTRPVLAAADIVLLTSRTEGVPGVVLEAQASGLPVVAVDVGGVAEVVVDGCSGRLVDADTPDLVGELATEIRWALERAPVLGAAGRIRVVDHLGIDAVADRWVDLLTAVADHRGPNPPPPPS